MTPAQQYTISAKANFVRKAREVKRSGRSQNEFALCADARGEGMTPAQQYTISAKANFVREAREVKRSGRSQNEFPFFLMRGGKV
ncbi:hypothetical protein ACTJLC_03955 [Paraburkholderia sp. 22099]|jgi:hypothetical protein|uniref:hypothetical protein n=1 Tax=Paraburkholderia sp. 22099 TaxID=3453875 RepID=UPI003F865827